MTGPRAQRLVRARDSLLKSPILGPKFRISTTYGQRQEQNTGCGGYLGQTWGRLATHGPATCALRPQKRRYDVSNERATKCEENVNPGCSAGQPVVEKNTRTQRSTWVRCFFNSSRGDVVSPTSPRHVARDMTGTSPYYICDGTGVALVVAGGRAVVWPGKWPCRSAIVEKSRPQPNNKINAVSFRNNSHGRQVSECDGANFGNNDTACIPKFA